MAIPVILLGLVLVAAFGASTVSLVVILGILFAPATARIARSSLLAELRSDYYLAAVSVGASGRRIVARELLPNALPVLIARASPRPRRGDLRRGEPELRRARDPAAGHVVGNAAAAGVHEPLPLVHVRHLPGARDPHRRARAQHARRQPPEGPRPLPAHDGDAPETATDVVLDVRDLVGRDHVAEASSRSGRCAASRSTSARGRRLGIVGESGSGKSLTALSLMRLLPPRARIAAWSRAPARERPRQCLRAGDGARPRRPDLDRLPGSDVLAEPAA